MHAEAYEYIGRWATADAASIVEFGSRETWGPRIRDLFPGAVYFGIDAVDGPGVDRVANAADWPPRAPVTASLAEPPVVLVGEPIDIVICAEVFEHTPRWRDIVANALRCLAPGGRAIFTCAGPGRPVHGVNHDDPDQPGWYANVTPTELWAEMVRAGFVGVRVELGANATCGGTDTYGTGVRP